MAKKYHVKLSERHNRREAARQSKHSKEVKQSGKES